MHESCTFDGQIDIFIALRHFETAEWHDIITRGTRS